MGAGTEYANQRDSIKIAFAETVADYLRESDGSSDYQTLAYIRGAWALMEKKL